MEPEAVIQDERFSAGINKILTEQVAQLLWDFQWDFWSGVLCAGTVPLHCPSSCTNTAD